MWPQRLERWRRYIEDAADRASIAQQEAATIGGLIRDGFTPESAVKAVMNNDWSGLEHTGLTSVQLLPPSTGEEPLPGVGNTPAITAGPDKQPPALPAGASGNGQKAGASA